MTDLEPRLDSCFETVFPTVSSDEVRSLSAEVLDEWDSVATVMLISVIEEEFDITFSDDAIERAVSYGELLAYVRETAG